MIYTDEENKRWWDSLSKFDQEKALERMVKESTLEYRTFTKSLETRYKDTGTLTPKQAGSVRRWLKK